ncbi:MAG TPA: GNAT family N-acetyltransferase [Acidimicrobiales bacterium]
MAVVIGRGAPAQFEAILSFWVTAAEVASSTDDLAGLNALWRHDPDALIVATDGNDIVGSLIAGWDGWRAGFYRLAVHPDYRHQGIGRSLVKEGEDRLCSLGARRLSLFAVEAHAAAMAFWSSVGYRRDYDDVRFVQNLPPPVEN